MRERRLRVKMGRRQLVRRGEEAARMEWRRRGKESTRERKRGKRALGKNSSMFNTSAQFSSKNSSMHLVA